MLHPLVSQLRFTRAEWLRALDGVTEEEGIQRLGLMNSVGWIVGHLSWQEQRYWLTFMQDKTPHPDLNDLVGYGRPATTPSLAEMMQTWHTITAATDPWLDTVTTATLETPIVRGDWQTNVGSLLLRVIYHYWYHIGEIMAIRQGLGQTGLPDFVGNIDDEAPYQAEPSPADKRQTLLTLSAAGQREFALINSRSREEISAMLSNLAPSEQQRVVTAMATIEEILAISLERRVPYLLRPHQPGDMGWIVHRHAVLYVNEYGWDESFEALVAEIVAHFIQNFDTQRETCWIAEMDGQVVGSVMVVKQSDEIAKLRLLLVEPQARGLGIGARLVEECIRFARQKGYGKLVLWTNSILVGARRLYERAGFTLVASEPHHSFGHDLVGETWELKL